MLHLETINGPSEPIELCDDAPANAIYPDQLSCELDVTNSVLTFATGDQTKLDIHSICTSITPEKNIARKCEHDLGDLSHENGTAQLTIRPNGVQFDAPALWDATGFDPMGVIEKVKTAPFTQDSQLATPMQPVDTFATLSELSKRPEVHNAVIFESIIGLIFIISLASTYLRKQSRRKLPLPTTMTSDFVQKAVKPSATKLSPNEDPMSPKYVSFDKLHNNK